MSEIKIGDRVHARFPYCDGVAIGTVTAIERSAGATVYCVLVDEAETPSRATAAWLVEVTTESGTAENLRAALARCTEERDEARKNHDALAKERVEVAKERDFWRALAGERYERMQAFEAERDALYRRAAQLAGLLRAEGEP